MRAKVTTPNGTEIVINALPAEIRRLSALKDHRVQLLPEHPASSGSWLYQDLRKPGASA